jgi:hypothetical protein
MFFSYFLGKELCRIFFGCRIFWRACFLRIFRCSSGKENHTRAASLHVLLKWSSGVAFLRSSEPRRSKLPAGNPAPERNPGLKCTRTGAIFKKFYMKTNVKSKINVIRKYFELRIYPTKPSVGF